MKTASYCCAWFAMLAAVGSAAATIVSIDPSVEAQAETQNGTNWVLTYPVSDVNCGRWATIALQRRGVLEYSLSSIPAGATIQSASISYSVWMLTNPPYPVIEFHGYQGNGQANLADAAVPFNLIGTSPSITGLADYTTSLDPAYVQSARSGTGYLGLMLYQGALSSQVSIESGAVLQIDYVPEPSSLAALGLGLLAVLRRRR